MLKHGAIKDSKDSNEKREQGASVMMDLSWIMLVVKKRSA
jgi:hypothetical protein